MKNILLLTFLVFCTVSATVINVPSDSPTIQGGINSASGGDTVLVSDGIYYENLSINKEITVASHFIIDGNISHRDSTIIDGSNYDEDSGPFGSCVLFRPPQNGDDISSKLTGFTIQNGWGTRVKDSSGEQVVSYYMGGGLMIWYTLPEITYNYIRNNGNEPGDTRGRSAGRGGGAALSRSEDVEFDDDRSNTYPSKPQIRDDEIIFSNNIFENNDSETGNTFESIGYVGEMDFSDSFFDVFASDNEDVSEYWVATEATTDFTGASGELEAITYDVWVSPDGMDESITTGTDQDPFKTIDYAMSRIYGTASDPITVNLFGVTYAPSTTGEEFPIILISNVNLIGQGEEVTIIDGMQSNRVITMDNCQNNIISDLTIANGLAEGESSNRGGGMALSFSNPILNHLTIANNHAYHGGGMALYFSNPILNHLTITGNTATASGGILLYTSNPTLNNVIISNNTVTGDGEGEDFGGGMALVHSKPTLNNVTISENTANEGGGMHLTDYNPFGEPSAPIIHNSIIWGNTAESIFIANSGTPLVNYSDIQGGWEGEGNIDADPLFVNVENGDFSLQNSSPCTDSGNPNLWYNDTDGSSSDMGTTGGSNILPNFISHNFGDIGDLGAEIQFNLFNYRESAITINSAELSSSSFTLNSSFPITIDPLQTSIINIEANNSVLGHIEDEMILVSNDLPQGISVSLSLYGVLDNVLTGNLSGSYPADTYRISGDLIIASGGIVTLQPGTQFLFDGEYNFNIYGTLEAIGTEADSIIFDNFGNGKWRGFTLHEASDETVFKYVRISGSQKGLGGGMRFTSSNASLFHVTISGNSSSSYGGGIYISRSNPTLEYVTVSGNSTINLSDGFPPPGGGIVLDQSNPTLSHVIIAENTAMMGAGIYFMNCNNSTLNNVTISGNAGSIYGGGVALDSSHPTLNHVTISGNSVGFSGGGIYLNQSNPQIINSIIWGNIGGMEGDSQIGISGDEVSTPLITYSDIEGGWEGDENISVNPLFSDSENSDYTLQEVSPCIDSGTADLNGDGIDDMTEYIGSSPDMGAFEFGAVYGCTDPEASNFNPEANIDDGSCELLTVSEGIVSPATFTLHQNYPNPFNPITSLRYDLPEQAQVTLNIYDLMGREITQLINTTQEAGFKSVQWNATDMHGKPVSAGVYLYQIRAGEFVQTKKMVLLK